MTEFLPSLIVRQPYSWDMGHDANDASVLSCIISFI